MILDIETEPFLFGRDPRPFAVGIYKRENDGIETYIVFWGEDCIYKSVVWLRAQKERYIVYAHNGGGFDFKGYYTEFLTGSLRIINGRIIQCNIEHQELRDSYALMPFPLRDYSKDEIDYKKFEANVREKHKPEIVAYLRNDCKYLYDLVSTFWQEFGQTKLTIGSTAMTEIQSLHTFETTDISFDREIRPKFFAGGRNQCFEAGIIEGPVSIYDINSMYPDVMKNCLHPIADNFDVSDTIGPDTCFLDVRGINRGALATRMKDGGLSFEMESGTFSTTIHEYRAAVETGTFDTQKIIRCYDFDEQNCFDKFVDRFYDLRKSAKLSGDAIRTLLYKFVLNSGYGKFSQNPANFCDWKFAKSQPSDPCPHCKATGRCKDCFKCEALNEYKPTGGICRHCEGTRRKWILHEFDRTMRLYRARTGIHHYYNVATGSSITGAARAKLLRGLSQATRPIYCDTDSIICSGFAGHVDGAELGAWKFEGAGTLCAIAGKKLYAIFADSAPNLSAEDQRKYPWQLEPVKYRGRKLYCIKKAHKGARLAPAEILAIAGGAEIEVPNPVPCFNMDGTTKPYNSRRIRRTA